MAEAESGEFAMRCKKVRKFDSYRTLWDTEASPACCWSLRWSPRVTRLGSTILRIFVFGSWGFMGCRPDTLSYPGTGFVGRKISGILSAPVFL